MEKERTSESLFVTLKKPHDSASAATIASWLKKVIDMSGQTGSGGSTRSVATSTAFRRGVPLETVLNAADWSRASTFRKYYWKSEPVSFDRKVLK
jgi:hypothetical protein